MTAVREACVAWVERGPRVLCVWNKRYGGWTFPGGMREHGESRVQCCARELFEETGTTLAAWALAYDADAEPTPEHLDRASHVYVFKASIMGSPTACEAGCAVRWLTVDEFLELSPFRAFYRRMYKLQGRAVL